MNDDHIKAEISSYLAGSLPESRNRQIEAHAAACDKCRNALTKARAKQARVKREALKKADAMPNLFLTRQGKMAGFDRPGSKAPLVFVGVVLLGGASFWGLRHSSFLSHSMTPPIPEADPTNVHTSSATTTADNPVVTPSVAPVAEPAPAKPEPPKPPLVVQVQQEWKGPDSGIKDPRLVVIRNEEKWEALWNDMQSNDPRPEVNFGQHIVLGVFAGERPGESLVALDKIRDAGDVLSVPYQIISPVVHVSSAAPAAITAPAHPYLLALIPRVDKKIRLTEKETSR